MLELGLRGALARTLRTTNAIENLNGSIEHYTRNLQRWRSGEMIERWVCAALLEAQKKLRRIRGYKDMDKLIPALEQHTASATESSKAA